MISFYIFNLIMIAIAITNLIHNYKSEKTRYTPYNIAINVLAIVLLVGACLIKFFTNQFAVQ